MLSKTPEVWYTHNWTHCKLSPEAAPQNKGLTGLQQKPPENQDGVAFKEHSLQSRLKESLRVKFALLLFLEK